MSTAKKLPTLPEIVDKLGLIKAEIADLEVEEKRAVTTLKTKGAGEYCGKLFQATISTQVRNKRVDYEALAKAARISQQLIKNHTTTATVTTTTIDWEAVLKEVEVDPELLKKHTSGDEILVCKVTART